MENGILQSSGVEIGGIANENSGAINNCHIQLNIDLNTLSSEVGGIALRNEGVISNCTTTGHIKSSGAPNGTNTGGIVCLNDSDGTISNCKNEASITGSGNNGGIAMQNWGKISGCQNQGTLIYRYSSFSENHTTERSTGGIIGYNDGECTDCINSGIIKYGGELNSGNFIQPIMGQIIGTHCRSGILSGNILDGSVDTTGLLPNHGGGYDQTLYAKNAEYGKLE